MVTKVLDSWALIAFFEDEPAAAQVERMLDYAFQEKYKLLLSVINWGEIYYNTMREVSQEMAEQKVGEIATLPIEVVGVSENLLLTRQAAIYKAKYRMSYTDCFGAALAKLKGAEFVTGDLEFKEVEKEIKVHWLR